MDVKPDRAVGAQPQAGLVGGVDLDVELDGHSGQAAGHARAGAGGEPAPVSDVEIDRSPVLDPLRVREHLEQLLGRRL